MRGLIAVALGAAIGAGLRYGVLLLLPLGKGFPWATFLVNMAGCLALGMLAGAAQAQEVDETMRLFLAVGVLGSFTTFSTFALEGVQMTQRGETGLAALYVAGSVIAGLLLAWGGMALGASLGN